ncbi:MAG: PAS domain-containing protein, partial [Alphaproteobacteria bacterium]
DEPLDVVIRLAGTRLVDFIGAELKGMSVRRLFRRPPEFVEKLWSPLFREARPRLDAGNLAPLEKPYVDYVAVHVPLTARDGRVRYAAFRAIFSLDGGKTWS